MLTQHQQTIESIARTLNTCRSVLFVTGAGVSADSGLPTYRGIGGLYDIDDTEDGLPIERILSGSMLRSNPELTWKYLGQIAEATRGATYNRAHEIIAEIERRFPRVWTLTQNVDGFHRQAGAENVIEIHGNLHSLSCTRCDLRLSVDASTPLELPPCCPDCTTILRPDAVLFGEMLPEAALDRLRRELETGFGMVFSIGTSSVFPYIQQPMVQARKLGVPTVEINPGETPVTRFADYVLPLRAADAMEAIWKAFQYGGSAGPE